ncbi:MAG: hypothetical protein JW841_17420 [Deltaproteobacteria bacterium]|nr:hypothetical protein [Deltaproteobacteria bacterium]
MRHWHWVRRTWMTQIIILLSIYFLASCSSKGKQCPEGTLNCPCKKNNICDLQLVCIANKCSANTAGLKITDANARACELVVHDQAGLINSVQFSDSILGSYLRRGANLAISFTARTDTALQPSDVAITYVSRASTQQTAAPTIITSHCFDRLGKTLPNVSLSLLP